MLSSPYNLHYFNHMRDLRINSNALIKEIRVIIFYIKEDLELVTSFIKTSEYTFYDKKIRKYLFFS